MDSHSIPTTTPRTTQLEWKNCPGGVPQGAILGLILCNILGDLGDELECILASVWIT